VLTCRLPPSQSARYNGTACPCIVVIDRSKVGVLVILNNATEFETDVAWITCGFILLLLFFHMCFSHYFRSIILINISYTVISLCILFKFTKRCCVSIMHSADFVCDNYSLGILRIYSADSFLLNVAVYIAGGAHAGGAHAWGTSGAVPPLDTFRDEGEFVHNRDHVTSRTVDNMSNTHDLNSG
jgi:hypothetical protein